VSSFELEHLDAQQVDGACVRVAGEVDLSNATELAEQLGEVPATKKLVLDLNRIVFIDSAALHVLFDVARRRGRDRLAFVVEPTAPIATTLAIVELHRAAPVTGSLEEARAALEHATSTPS
jgi:anti-anti-sigma factor